jgi:hypothetical protein
MRNELIKTCSCRQRMKRFFMDQLSRMCISFSLEVLTIQTVIFQNKQVHCTLDKCDLSYDTLSNEVYNMP